MVSSVLRLLNCFTISRSKRVLFFFFSYGPFYANERIRHLASAPYTDRRLSLRSNTGNLQYVDNNMLSYSQINGAFENGRAANIKLPLLPYI